MIPKCIHYCWFGGNPLPKQVRKCIASWEMNCPDYNIQFWNEDNFNISCHPYMLEAYQAGRWAFVSDLARLLIVYQNGGIYLDTDVELVGSLDAVIDNTFFFAIEKYFDKVKGRNSIHVATGLGFGAEKGNQVLKRMIAEYDGIHFKRVDGTFDFTPCPKRNSRALETYGFSEKDELLRFEGGTIYPSEYFCPIEYKTGKKHFTKNTVSIHHYSASWKTEKEKFIENVKISGRIVINKLGGGIRK